MSRSPCLVCTLGSGSGKARMVAMFDTGATHNVMSKRSFGHFNAADVYLETVRPLVKNLKSVTGLNFEISGIYRVQLPIGACTQGVEFLVDPSVSVDMVISYQNMRDYGWNIGCADHALVAKGRKFGFLTLDTFERLTKSHWIRSFRPVSLCAEMSITVPPNAKAFIPIEVNGDAGVDLVMFEPDPAYIRKYHAFPCPGLVGMDKFTKLAF